MVDRQGQQRVLELENKVDERDKTIEELREKLTKRSAIDQEFDLNPLRGADRAGADQLQQDGIEARQAEREPGKAVPAGEARDETTDEVQGTKAEAAEAAGVQVVTGGVRGESAGIRQGEQRG